MEPFAPGDILLDKYVVQGTLGKGGMGQVLAAHDRELDRPVAIKFLLASLRDKPDSVTRFEREARTSARIQNEHVARIYSVERLDGVPFLVMEKLTGDDLAVLLRDRGKLRVEEAVDFVLQASEAVAQAHALGIVHRDLKPANLFLARVSSTVSILKVLDFGISKTAAEDATLTAGAAMLGSPVYMSPEQFESARTVDGRSDLWSLGVVLYELLAGKVPFPGDSIGQVCAAVQRGVYPPLSSHRPDVPPALEAVLAETLVERGARIPTIEALAKRLAPFGTDEARASCSRVEGIASEAALQASPGKQSLADDWPAGTGDETKNTAPGLVPSPPAPELLPPETAPELVESAVKPRRTSRRWVGFAALGVAACAAVAVRVTASAGTPVPAPLPSASSSAAPVASVARADSWEAACDGGDAGACNSAGLRYAHGDGVIADLVKAFGFYKRACDGKLALGCVNAGAMLYDGVGVLKDEKLAVELFSQACEDGAPAACLDVGIAYADGHGMPKDPTLAFGYFDRACTGNVLVGCTRAALAKIAGEGVAKDVKGGMAQLDALCDKHEPLACKNFAALQAKGAGPEAPVNLVRSGIAVAKACDAGSDAACGMKHLLGTASQGATAQSQYNLSFRTKCDQGSLVGCAMLGLNLVDGIGTGVNREEGVALLHKACDGHVKQACDKLAKMGIR